MANPRRIDLQLPGCSPEPLMAYLKALGVLRLVSDQKDGDARGWWKNDMFWLQSALDSDSLKKFFLEEYRPTPIVAPWASKSGFFPGDNTQAVNSLSGGNASRCQAYADIIHRVQGIIASEKIGAKPKGADKSRLIRRYRRELPDDFIAWIDTVMVLQRHQEGFAPLLGTGGNDGRLDFTQNFMQRIVLLGLHTQGASVQQSSLAWLEQSLFLSPARLCSASVGQFAPGRAGGPNAAQGMYGDSMDNPWDFILMIEGTLMLAGAAVRRFGVGHSALAAFPFTVRMVAAGFDSAVLKEAHAQESRGELWLPVWSRRTSTAELRRLFGEGRADISSRAARNGADFARAVAGLGVDRGISEFRRLGFLKRSGKSFLAAPLGRFEVVARTGVDLLREVDPWLERFRSAAADKKAPPRFGSMLRRIDSAIFDFCKYGGTAYFLRILVALGATERELAAAEQFREAKKLKPLVGLSAAWIEHADDGSREFAIARSLASVHDPERNVGPLRANLEPIAWQKKCRAWAEKERSVVWNAVDLAANLVSVLQRRMLDGARAGCEHLPLASHFQVPRDTIAAFLGGELDDERIKDLIWGLMLVDHRRNGQHRARGPVSEPSRYGAALLAREYALLKLLFLPRPLVPEGRGDHVKWRLARRLTDGRMEAGLIVRPEPRVVPLLRAGRMGEACRIAVQRLRISGLSPIPGPLPSGKTRDDEWAEEPSDSIRGQRLAAALLIPVSSKSVSHLIDLVCRTRSPAAEALAVSVEGETK